MHTFKHPIGGPLTRDYYQGMLDKAWRVEPPTAIKEVRMSRQMAKQLLRFDNAELDPESSDPGPKDWPYVDGVPIVFDINHKPRKHVTVVREDGLQVSFPVDC